MAVWYCGSVQHAAIAQWAAGQAVSIGDIRRQLAAPAAGNARAFRCTTAGTTGGAEPTWNLGVGATTNDNGVVWTEVTGNSTYGWSAAAQNLLLLTGSRMAVGDTAYVASNHAYSQSASINYSAGGSAVSPYRILCVNPAGSVPPVAADITTGASEATTTGTITLAMVAYIEGVKFAGGSAGTAINCGGIPYMKNCEVSATTGGATIAITGAYVVWENTPARFASTASSINPASCRFWWKDTPSPFPGSVPSTLFNGNMGLMQVLVEGVDLSGVGTSLVDPPGVGGNSISFVNCDIHASASFGTILSLGDNIDLIVSASGASPSNVERRSFYCAQTTELTHVRTGGANDGVNAYAWKLVSGINLHIFFPFESFPISVWNDVVGSPVTVSVAIMNDGTTLTNADIWLEVCALDDAGEPLGGFYTSGVANVLTAGSNIATDATSTWDTTGIGSPVKQVMSVTFTPQIEGYIRARVRMAKANKTLYVDPYLQVS